MQWQVGVTTAPREGVSYLNQTVGSLHDAGWQDVRIFDDDACQLGPWRNFKRAAAALLEDAGRFDWFAIFQDDIMIAKNTREYVERCKTTRDALDLGNVLSLYTAGPHHNIEGGWIAIANDDLPRKCYGALGVVMSRETIEDLLAHEEIGKHVRNKTDFWIGKFCLITEREYLQHSPSLIKHMGEVSSLEGQQDTPKFHNDYFRQCREWQLDAAMLETT